MATERSNHGSLAAGAAGGLIGGLVSGAIMQGAGMMPIVARLVGRETAVVGWMVHLGIAVLLGLVFALLSQRPRLLLSAIAQGLLWGFTWWVVGGLILLPLRLGEEILALNSTSWRSLGAHLAYGIVLGAVYGVWAKGLRPGGHAISGPVDTVRGPHPLDTSEQLPPSDQKM